MKRAIVWVAIIMMALFLSSALVAGVAEGDKEKFEEKFAKTEAMAPEGKFSLSNISGDVDVKTWDKAEVKIDALKVSWASSKEKAAEFAKQVTIEVTNVENGVNVEVKYPKGHWKGNVSVDFVVLIPAKAALSARTVSGDMNVEKIGGICRAGSVSGDVTVAGASKAVDADTVSGDVKVSDVTGDVEAKTVSGDATLENITGSASAATVSGDIILGNISGAKKIKASVVSGDIDFSGKIHPEGWYSFESHSGDVTVVVPADAAFDFEGSTFSGDISSDFKMEVSGKITKGEFRGVVNGGGASLKLKSFNGSIRLKKS